MDVDTSVYRRATKALQDDILAKLTTMDADTGAMSGYLATLAGMAEGEMGTLIAGFEDESDWTLLNDETETKADTTTHITGEGAVSFAKVTGGEVIAGLKRALGAAIDLSDYVGDSVLGLNIYLSDITSVVSVEVRLGTDVDNTQVWRVLVKDLTAGWNLCSFPVGDVETDVGDGWNDAAVAYAVVGVNFSAATDTLAGIIVDNLSMRTAGAETVRAKIAEASAAKVATDRVMLVQHVDESGEVLDSSDLDDTRKATEDGRQLISNFAAHATFGAFNAQTTNKADTTTHITGAGAVTFDKATGAKLCGLTDTIDAVDLSYCRGQAVVNLNIYMSTIVDVLHVEIRLGTDATNAQVWKVLRGELKAGWNMISVPFSAVEADLGDGWDDAAVTYLAVLVNFQIATATLTGIIIDSLSVQGARAMSIQPDKAMKDDPDEIVLDPCNGPNELGPGGDWRGCYGGENFTRGTEHITGTGSVSFDKMEFYGPQAGAQKDGIVGFPVDASRFGPGDFIAVTFKCPDTTYVYGAEVQIGKPSYLSFWKWGKVIPNNEWVTLYARIGDAYDCWEESMDLSEITHVSFFLYFSVSHSDCDSILLDRISIVSAAKAYAATHGFAPTASNALEEVATTDAEWTAITLTVGATEAVFSLEGASAYVVCQTATPTDADYGAIMFPNITYALKTRGRTKIWIRRVTTDVTIHVTDSM